MCVGAEIFWNFFKKFFLKILDVIRLIFRQRLPSMRHALEILDQASTGAEIRG